MHLILRLRGGGDECTPGSWFSDLRSARTIQFSKDAPDWRTAAPGLCVEGECVKLGCCAYGKMVIDSRGFGEFSLALDKV